MMPAGTCKECGCTDFNACISDFTGKACEWVENDLCSFCSMAMIDSVVNGGAFP